MEEASSDASRSDRTGASTGGESILPSRRAEGARLLEVRKLKTHLFLKRGVVRAVDGVSFDLAAGQTLGLIGESGSGKTMTGLSLLGLPPKPAGRIVSGSIRLGGTELAGMEEEALAESVRGSRIAMISQDPMTSLNPVFTIGSQVAAPIRAHVPENRSRAAALDLAVQELDRVRVPSARARARDYPHQFSGGMRQRVVAAMAIACIAVMYAGRIVELADVDALYGDPRHPYTQGLLASVPRLGRRKRLVSIPGNPPNPLALPSGCAFHPRCPSATERCRNEAPPEVTLTAGAGDSRRVACWLEA